MMFSGRSCVILASSRGTVRLGTSLSVLAPAVKETDDWGAGSAFLNRSPLNEVREMAPFEKSSEKHKHPLNILQLDIHLDAMYELF